LADWQIPRWTAKVVGNEAIHNQTQTFAGPVLILLYRMDSVAFNLSLHLAPGHLLSTLTSWPGLYSIYSLSIRFLSLRKLYRRGGAHAGGRRYLEPSGSHD